MDTACTHILLPSIFSKSHITRPEKIHPIIYPPVAPKRAPGPALKFEKTGTPIKPSSKYTQTETVPLFPPRKLRVRYTAKVCIVNGTMDGIDIQAHTAIRTAKSAMKTISLVLFICTSFLILLPRNIRFKDIFNTGMVYISIQKIAICANTHCTDIFRIFPIGTLHFITQVKIRT